MHTEHWKTNIHSIIIVHFSGEQRPLPVLGMWGTDRQTMIIDDLIFSITACSIGVVLDSSWCLNNMNSIRSWSVEEHSIIIVSPFFRRALYPGLRSWFSRKNRLFFKNKNRSHILRRLKTNLYLCQMMNSCTYNYPTMNTLFQKEISVRASVCVTLWFGCRCRRS